MEGGYEYIRQNYPGYQFSSVRYVQSKVVGGNAVANIAVSNQNAKGVLLRSIQWDVINNAAMPAAPVVFTDSNGSTLLRQAALGGYNEKSYFDYYVNYKVQVSITANSPLVSFIVEYQLLSLPENTMSEIK